MRLLIVGARSKTAEALLRLIRRSGWKWELLLLSHRRQEPMSIHGYPVYVIPEYARQPLRNACLSWEPEVIVNTAALTDVDACESNRRLAWQLNVGLVETLVGVCRVLGAHLVQLSSDYVFDGAAGPYPEEARPNPVNYYGKSKLAAENVCLAAAASVTIVRTTQIYGTPAPWCSDVLRWAFQKAHRGETVAAAVDVYTNPVFVDELAWSLACAIRERSEGILHVAGREWLSRYEFLRTAFRLAGLPEEQVVGAPAEELYRGRARRPRRGGLLCRRAETLWGFAPRSLHEALSLTLCRTYSGRGASGEST